MTTGDSIDLDAYLARIGYTGETEPTLAVLTALVMHHTTSIAFENIETVARRPPPLDLASLQRKMVRQSRGGYCFEQNTLFLGVLLALGFRVTGLAARVRRGFPPGFVGPRTHMLLAVDLPEGPHVVDVGFGGLTPTAPLAFRMDVGQATPNESFRLVAHGDEFLLQAAIAGGWEDVYQFSRQAQMAIDYEMGNWFTATRPGGMFSENLIVTQPSPGERRTLLNRYFTRRRRHQPVERQVLRERQEYEQILRDEFGLVVTEGDMDAIMALMAKHDPDKLYDARFA
jgi:N-hydroxyarylamine O-acetyltransferase